MAKDLRPTFSEVGLFICVTILEGFLTIKNRALPREILFALLLTILVLPSNISAGSVETHLSVSSILLKDSVESSLPVNAKWSFSAIDIETGKDLIDAGNARNISLMPGSLVKLFVTAAILDIGAKEKIGLDTIIAHDGKISKEELRGNLYLKGSGNAFLSEIELKKAVEEILSKGVSKISGDIIVDDTLFDTRGWESRYPGPAYSTPSALGLDMHTVSITISGRPPNIKIEPSNDSVRVSFNPDGKLDIRQIDDLTYEVSGQLSDFTLIKKRFPLKDPAAYALGTLKTLLKQRGITVKGTNRKGKTPSDARTIYIVKSKDLSEIVKDTNNNSLNVVAENLLLLLGAKRFGLPGTVEKGVMAVREFLSYLGLPSDGIAFADGSGLSPDNRITSEQMVSFLKIVSEKPWFKAFYESLPRLGMDGTLKNISYKNEHIRAKTGQFSDVYCLAGYIETKNKNKIAFSCMVNVPGADLLWGNENRIISLLGQIADE